LSSPRQFPGIVDIWAKIGAKLADFLSIERIFVARKA
jgi:hypothetical protein